MADYISMQAGGTIRTSRFVSGGAADHEIIESNAGDLDVVGVATEGSQDAPLPNASNLANAATDGEQCRFYPYGKQCRVEVGTGGLTRFVYAKPDADGKAIAATTTNDVAFFLPVESASEGELCLGWVISAYYVQ